MQDNCTLWQGAKNKAGYGITWFKNKWAYAHRAVVNATKGEIVRHTCDNPSCVNPKHLVIGSHKENSTDMVSKQRQAWGVRAARSKLTEDQVVAIRNLQGAQPSRNVAEIFGTSKTNVLDIWNKRTWKYL